MKAIFVGKNNNIIHINGKRYDARTGQLLDANHGASAPKHSTGVAAGPQSKDIGPRHNTRHQSAKPKLPVDHTPKSHATAKIHDVVRRPVKTKRAHQPEQSHTLMRSLVHKPEPSLKRRVKAHTHAGAIVKQPTITVATKSSAHRVDNTKLTHAKHINRSKLVRRFSSTPAVSYAPPVLPVIDQPPKDLDKQTMNYSSRRPRSTAELLDHAVSQATSHKQPKAPKPKKKSRIPRLTKRIGSISAMLLAIVVLFGFIAYSNLDNVKLQMASSKAGFSASLPNYKPAGYRLGDVNARSGEVAIHYFSNSDSRHFVVTEHSSSLDSQALKDSILADSAQDFQSVQSAGQTLYFYNDDRASWVTGGILYEVDTNGAINNAQVIRLVASL